MTTLADELLNDFEDSTSEEETEHPNGFLHNAPTPPTAGNSNGHPRAARDSAGSMELDMDEEDGEEDGEMINGDILGSEMLAEPDEEEAKAKVEKMQLGGVNDVRNVAGLMKTLEPFLEVGYSSPKLFHPVRFE